MFSSDELENDLRAAIVAYLKGMGDPSEWEEFPFPEKDGTWEEPAHWDPEVVVDGDFAIPVAGVYNPLGGRPEVSVREFIDLVSAAQQSKVIDNATTVTPSGTYFALETASHEAHVHLFEGLASHLAEVEAELVVDGGTSLQVSLVRGVQVPHVLRLWSRKEHFSDYVPSYSEHEVFIHVGHDSGTSREAVRSAATAFLFELSSTTGLTWGLGTFYGRRDPEDAHYSFNREFERHVDDPPDDFRLFPLLDGPGIEEVCNYFLKAQSDELPTEYRFLEYVKVLEFVSATVVRQDSHETLRTRLRTPAALRPDAEFLDSLLAVMERKRVYRKDSEALKLVLLTCTSTEEMFDGLPESVKKRIGRDVKDRAQVKRFAAMISASRNQVAHAKANYNATGDEFAPDEYEAVLPALRYAAIQSIRWFAALPSVSRAI